MTMVVYWYTKLNGVRLTLNVALTPFYCIKLCHGPMGMYPSSLFFLKFLPLQMGLPVFTVLAVLTNNLPKDIEEPSL